jgi:hypothetical protein
MEITRMNESKPKIKKRFPWIPLNTDLSSFLINDRFVIKNVLGDGNCQFRAIEEALKHTHITQTTQTANLTHKQLRTLLAERILTLSENDFHRILDTYILEKKNGDFVGNWDPLTTKTRVQLSNHIKKKGFHFQGDHYTLSLLSNILNIDFIIIQNNYTFFSVGSNHDQVILLYYDKNHTHYQLIGIRDKRDTRNTFKSKYIKTIFSKHDPEITPFLDRKYFFDYHIRHIKHLSDKQFTLNELCKLIEKNTYSSLTKNDKKIISTLC